MPSWQYLDRGNIGISLIKTLNGYVALRNLEHNFTQFYSISLFLFV